MQAEQLSIDFSTKSPININRLVGQNKRLYNWLAAGNTIHCFHEAMFRLRIGYLNSRISDLINKNNVSIKKKRISIPDEAGNPVYVVEYSL